MKFKRSTKKESPKKDAVLEEKVSQDTLTKEEIKELVEETVDEALKEKEEKQPELETTEEETVSSPETTAVEVAPAEDPEEQEEGKEINEEANPEITPNETPATTPDLALVDEKAQGSLDTIPEQSEQTKVEEAATPSAATIPVISVSGVAPGNGEAVIANKSGKSENKKFPLILLFIVFVICGFVVGISILSLLSKNNFKFSSVTSILKHAPTPTPTTAPTPTPEPVNMAQYKISVLNGSGVAGAAAAAKGDLTSAGFTVISTGNASSNTTQTTVAVKSSVDQATLEKLLQTLAGKYTVSSHTQSLSDSDAADIVVTVGTAK